MKNTKFGNNLAAEMLKIASSPEHINLFKKVEASKCCGDKCECDENCSCKGECSSSCSCCKMDSKKASHGEVLERLLVISEFLDNKGLEKSAALTLDLIDTLSKVAVIKELSNGKFRVVSKKGKNLGTFDSEKAAKKRLQEVEFFKHKKAGWEDDSDSYEELFGDEDFPEDELPEEIGYKTSPVDEEDMLPPIKLTDQDDSSMVSVDAMFPGAGRWAKEVDQSIEGSNWESDDPDYAYAIIDNRPGLLEDLEKSYNVDSSEFTPMDSYEDVGEVRLSDILNDTPEYGDPNVIDMGDYEVKPDLSQFSMEKELDELENDPDYPVLDMLLKDSPVGRVSRHMRNKKKLHDALDKYEGPSLEDVYKDRALSDDCSMDDDGDSNEDEYFKIFDENMNLKIKLNNIKEQLVEMVDEDTRAKLYKLKEAIQHRINKNEEKMQHFYDFENMNADDAGFADDEENPILDEILKKQKMSYDYEDLENNLAEKASNKHLKDELIEDKFPKYTSVGSYPIIYVDDGDVYCSDCAKEKHEEEGTDFLSDINWESTHYCDACGDEIEVAYPEESDEDFGDARDLLSVPEEYDVNDLLKLQQSLLHKGKKYLMGGEDIPADLSDKIDAVDVLIKKTKSNKKQFRHFDD